MATPAGRTVKEVFLSYGREPEVSAFVKQLKGDIETRGISVWLDTDDIPAGSDWHGAIGTGLQQSKALIAVITTKYLNSKFCTNELYTASSDQKAIFPIILENIDFSASERSRGVKYVIGSINWTMFGTGYDYNNSLEHLVQGMKQQGLGDGVGTASSGQADEPVTNMMSTMNLSPHTSTPHAPPHPPSSAPVPHVSPHTNYISPTPGYFNPHGTPQHQPVFYPYSPPQGHVAGYSPSAHPYPYSYHTPPHSSPYHHTMSVGVTPPPPPYTAEGTDSGAASTSAALPKTPLTAGEHNPVHPSAPSPAQTTPSSQVSTISSQPVVPTPVDTAALFKVGMKLEATDRRFPYFVCVATIMDRRDSEVLVHFDGWGPEYDYWCPANSVELHPPGWCSKHDWELQTPINQTWTSWEHYLNETDSPATPESIFSKDQIAGPGSLLFEKDMKLEAKDRQNPDSIGVATIANIKDGRLLIHFDGWTTRYDYWCRPESTDIHPPHWCGKNHRSLHPPHGYSSHFKWSVYLRQPGPVPAPAFIFTKEQRAVSSDSSSQHTNTSTTLPTTPNHPTIQGFKVGMRLEAKDRKYPSLTCAATITDITNGKLLIHFDGWNNSYDYLCEPKSTDVHPVGWCQMKGRELNKPKGYYGEFKWDKYLAENGYVAAPSNLFTPEQKT